MFILPILTISPSYTFLFKRLGECTVLFELWSERVRRHKRITVFLSAEAVLLGLMIFAPEECYF